MLYADDTIIMAQKNQDPQTAFDVEKYKSYELILSVSDYASLFEQWHVEICISKYHPPKATEVQNNDIN